MNEQLQIALAELINKSAKGIEKAGGFVQAEIPDVVRQLLWWHAFADFILFCFGVVSLIAYIYGLKHFVIDKWDELQYSDYEIFVVLGVVLTPSIPIFLLTSLDWLKIWVAPKVWLLEYAAELAK